MLKKLHILLLTLLAAACFTVTAWADYDYIEQYGGGLLYRHRMGGLRLHRAVRRYGDAQHGGRQPAYHREAGMDAAGGAALRAGAEDRRAQRLHPGRGGADGQHRAAGLRQQLYVRLPDPGLRRERDLFLRLLVGAGVYVPAGRQRCDLRLHRRLVRRGEDRPDDPHLERPRRADRRFHRGHGQRR